MLADVVAPAEECCSVAPSGARLAGETSDVLLNSSRQLQSKFKHAGDFGVDGNYNRANAARFSEALNQHINRPLTTAIEGTYRGSPVTHYLDPFVLTLTSVAPCSRPSQDPTAQFS